jgi:hypothetical protein
VSEKLFSLINNVSNKVTILQIHSLTGAKFALFIHLLLNVSKAGLNMLFEHIVLHGYYHLKSDLANEPLLHPTINA